MIVKRESRRLLCKLTPDEWMERAARLAALNQEIAAEESRQADQKATMKATLATMEAERDTLSGVVVRREEMRDVEVAIDHDNARMRVVIFRTDTHDSIVDRPMNDDERQRALPLSGEAARA